MNSSYTELVLLASAHCRLFASAHRFLYLPLLVLYGSATFPLARSGYRPCGLYRISLQQCLLMCGIPLGTVTFLCFEIKLAYRRVRVWLDIARVWLDRGTVLCGAGRLLPSATSGNSFSLLPSLYKRYQFLHKSLESG